MPEPIRFPTKFKIADSEKMVDLPDVAEHLRGSKVDAEGGGTHDEDMPTSDQDLKDSISDLKVASADLRAFVREGMADMKVRSAEMDARFEKLVASVDTGFSGLRADMHKSQSDMKGWVVATVLAILFGFAALVFRLPSGNQSAPAPAAPPVIVVPPYQSPAPATTPPATEPLQPQG